MRGITRSPSSNQGRSGFVSWTWFLLSRLGTAFVGKDVPDGSDDRIFFSGAKMLSANENIIYGHPDLQQVQIEALLAFYFLVQSQVNRWDELSSVTTLSRELFKFSLHPISFLSNEFLERSRCYALHQAQRLLLESTCKMWITRPTPYPKSPGAVFDVQYSCSSTCSRLWPAGPQAWMNLSLYMRLFRLPKTRFQAVPYLLLVMNRSARRSQTGHHSKLSCRRKTRLCDFSPSNQTRHSTPIKWTCN